jgi:hypothetical protein
MLSRTPRNPPAGGEARDILGSILGQNHGGGAHVQEGRHGPLMAELGTRAGLYLASGSELFEWDQALVRETLLEKSQARVWSCGWYARRGSRSVTHSRPVCTRHGCAYCLHTGRHAGLGCVDDGGAHRSHRDHNKDAVAGEVGGS